MARRRAFFATRSDLVPGLIVFERTSPVLYVRSGSFDSPEPQVAPSAFDLAGLGAAPSGDMMTTDRFLVLAKASCPSLRPVSQRDGGIKYMIDQARNPDSVVICFGGLHESGALISGELSTLGECEGSRRLFDSMAKLVIWGFECIGAYWVGPEARCMLDQGCRLTRSLRSPEDYDLTAESS